MIFGPGLNLGYIFNSRSGLRGHIQIYFAEKQLQTRHKPLLGSLPLGFELPDLPIALKPETLSKYRLTINALKGSCSWNFKLGSTSDLYYIIL
jgi:hypothetical protein